MYRTASNRRFVRWSATTGLLLGAAILPAGAQTPVVEALPGQATGPQRIVSSEISISREQAELKLELANGTKLTLTLVGGDSRGVLHSGVNGAPGDLSQVLTLGVERGDELDRSWRALLNEAMDTPTEEIGDKLVNWDAPEGGEELDRLLEGTLAGVAMTAAALPAPELSDSLTRLKERISELEERLEDEHAAAVEVHVDNDDNWERAWTSPLRHIGRGIAGVLSMLVTFAVLFGLGFATIFFGGRKYLEEVADTTRHATTRSFLVGLAASFLVIPAFVLGMVVLAVSIVGIPALLIWIPAFPLGVVLATLLGYLAVAHAAGEALAERRFYGGDWFSRANSYYYLISGIGLLLALFIAGNIIQMAGPWLGFIHGILMFLGVVLTWAAATTGFGAVLITRAGSRPIRTRPPAESEIYADASNI